MLLESWLDALRSEDWQVLDDEFGQNVVVMVPTGKGNLKQVKTWEQLEPKWRIRLTGLNSLELSLELKKSKCLVRARRDQEEPWSEPILTLEKHYVGWRLNQIALDSFESLLSGT